MSALSAFALGFVCGFVSPAVLLGGALWIIYRQE